MHANITATIDHVAKELSISSYKAYTMYSQLRAVRTCLPFRSPVADLDTDVLLSVFTYPRCSPFPPSPSRLW